MATEPMILDDLDRLATETFPGLVVRKDLLRRMRSAFGVPAFVIEFLLGKYCASTDEETIREGLEFVKDTLAAKYVKPDEREAVKSTIKQQSSFELIDKISVRLVETHDKYWARLSNLNLDYINIDDSLVRQHDRLLMGGVWAEIVLRYDDSYVFKAQNRPFFVERIRPIQLSTRRVDSFVDARSRFTTGQWVDLLMRSMGYEPNHPYYTHRRKLHYMLRLVPFVEKNYNLIELGPRGTGKSFVYQQLSPYCHLVSGGQATTAQMFVNLSTGQRGLVSLWDVVAFDEAAGFRQSLQHGLGHGNAQAVAVGKHRRVEGAVRTGESQHEVAGRVAHWLEQRLGKARRQGRAERVAIPGDVFDRDVPPLSRNRERDDAACLLEVFDLAACLWHGAARLDLVRCEIADLNQQVVQAVSRSNPIRRIEMLQLSLDEIERFRIEQLAQFRVAQQLAQLRLID